MIVYLEGQKEKTFLTSPREKSGEGVSLVFSINKNFVIRIVLD